MRDLLACFDREAKIVRSGIFPRCESFERRHSIKSRVDLDAVESRRIRLQHASIRKILGIELAFPFLVAEPRSAQSNYRHRHIMVRTGAQDHLETFVRA